MRWIGLAALGVLAALAACTPRPAPPITVTPPPPATPERQARLYDHEAEALAAYPDVATRNGDVLTLPRIAMFTNQNAKGCEGWETCSLWRFAGMVRLGGQLEPVVIRDNGEDSSYAVVDVDGHMEWLWTTPVVSSDGRYIATGSDGRGMGGGHVDITDWSQPYPRRKFMSGAGCVPQSWEGHALILTCAQRFEDIPARAVRKGQVWEITPSGFAPLVEEDAKPATYAIDVAEFELEAGFECIKP